MDVETKVDTFKSFAQEIVTVDELRQLFETNDHPLAYNGFEPSGLAAIHFGILMTKNLKKMLNVGVRYNFYLADYFALINNKMDGDIDKIREVGKYFVEVWKGAGIDTGKINLIWAKDLMDDLGYWDQFIRVGREVSLDRMKRAITIMGRKEGDAVSSAMLFYPAMQVTDIFRMGIDICQLGMDQRKANILAREVAKKLGFKIPVAVHNPYLLGLKGAPKDVKNMSDEEGMSFKMSKSDPKSSILVHDSFADIKSKINSAYCPERVVDGNPVMEYINMLILDDKSLPITIDRSQKFGGPIEATDYNELVKMYTEGKIHPMDLKGFVAEGLEKEIKPIREHFEKNKEARELYEKVKSYKITR
jgi:tyrosyl-tRNA synthetase